MHAAAKSLECCLIGDPLKISPRKALAGIISEINVIGKKVWYIHAKS